MALTQKQADYVGTNYADSAVANAVRAGIGEVTPTVFTNATRPSPTSVPVGRAIYNTDDNGPNYSDGTNWRDSTGVIT